MVTCGGLAIHTLQQTSPYACINRVRSTLLTVGIAEITRVLRNVFVVCAVVTIRSLAEHVARHAISSLLAATMQIPKA